MCIVIQSEGCVIHTFLRAGVCATLIRGSRFSSSSSSSSSSSVCQLDFGGCVAKKSLLHHRVMAKDGSLPGNYKKNTLNIGNYTRMLLISVFIAFTITYEVSNLKYWLKIEKIKHSIDIPRARVILTLPEEASLFMRSARGTRLFPLHDFFEQHRHRYHSTYPWIFLTYSRYRLVRYRIRREIG